MASVKKITMREYNGTDYDTLYPKTIASQVDGVYGEEEVLSDNTKALYKLGDTATPNDVFKRLFPAMPTGTISWLASETIPDGFLKCDGSIVAKADYPELYAVIGNTFGKGTDTTFQLPDLRAKFIRGAGTSGNYSATFGKPQQASRITTETSTKIVTNYDFYTSGDTYGYCFTNNMDAPKNTYALRPYNVALTPIIKYCGG